MDNNRNNLPPALQNLLRNPAVRGENGRFQARSAQAAQERREERRHRTLLETIKDGATVAVATAKQTGQNLPGGGAATAVGGVYGAAASELMQAVSWVKLDRFKRKPKPATGTTEATATVRNPSPASDSEERRPRGRPRNSSNPLAGLQGRARAIRRREIQADNASIRATRELQNLNESTDEATQADKTQHREIIDRLKGIIKAIRALQPLFGGIPRLGGFGGGGRGRNGRGGRNAGRGANGGYGGYERSRRDRGNRDDQRRRDDIQRRWDERKARRVPDGGKKRGKWGRLFDWGKDKAGKALELGKDKAGKFSEWAGGATRKGGGVVAGIGKKIGKVRGLGAIGSLLALAGIASTEMDDTLTREEKNREHGATAGRAATGLAGAAAGAAIGTMIFPGVGTVIGGIVGGIAADYFSGDAAAELGSEIADWLDNASLSELPGRIVDKVGEWTSLLMNSDMVQSIKDKFGEWTQTLKDTEIGKYITENWGELTTDISAKWDAFTNILADTWKNLKEGTQKTLEGVNDWIKDKTGIDAGAGLAAAGNAVIDAAAAVYNGAKEMASDAVSATKEAVTSAYDYTKEAARAITGNKSSASGSSQTAGYVIDKLQALGLTRNQAIGMAANFKQESEFRPGAEGDGGAAYGLGQWHADRQAKFREFTGRDIRGSSIDDQIKFAVWELRNTESRAGEKLAATSTPEQAAEVVSRFYERPKEVEIEMRRRAGIASTLNEEYANWKAANTDGGLINSSAKGLRVKASDGSTKTLDEMGVSSHADLQSKGGQAFQGGYNDPATLFATSLIQNGMGENFDRVTAQNDAYHNAKSPSSDHAKGTKTDFTLKGISGEDGDKKVAEVMACYGLQKGVDFETINEYDRQSDKATGGHIDFKLKEAGQAKIAQIMAMEKVATAKPVVTTTTETNTGYYDYGKPTTASTTAVARQESAIPAISPVKTPDPLPQAAMQPPTKAAPTHPLEQFKQGVQQSPMNDVSSIVKAINGLRQDLKTQQGALDQSKSGGFASHIPVDIDDAYWLRATNGSFA